MGGELNFPTALLLLIKRFGFLFCVYFCFVYQNEFSAIPAEPL